MCVVLFTKLIYVNFVNKSYQGLSVQKTFIGTQLRQLRRDAGQTQAEMARVLGISAAYVNLLEKNQRSLSVPVLMALADHYNVDWRDVVMDKSANILADLRNIWRMKRL